MTDVGTGSVGTCEYDPDDMGFEGSHARMATATVGKMPNTDPRFKLAATSDLNDFHGKDYDED
uniref:Uncharacterized protein n=1 Tax=Peronospora matthiolae TaxID=2874970 RepID=A0AAV1T9C9_9STRA